MDTRFEQQLFAWGKPFIRDQDLAVIYLGEETRRYDAVKLALKKGVLIGLRRGLYLIGPPYTKKQPDPFEIAGVIYGPSYISLESALSYHSWIPEAVYTTTSVSAKRSKTFETPLGVFRYSHVPSAPFFLNVERIESNGSIFIMAEPWKAIADMIYCYKKNWSSIHDLSSDLRIELDDIKNSDLQSLSHIAKNYGSQTVRKILLKLEKDIH